MATLPTGTITFLFTDIESSTQLLRELGENYSTLLSDYRRLLRGVCDERGGTEVDTQGDGLFFAFPTAKAALTASVGAQRLVMAHEWPNRIPVRIRMGLHTGEPISGETGYVGMDIHRAARICAAGHGGQILLSRTTHDLVDEEIGVEIELRDLGQHRLKDLARPLQLFQVVASDLPADFPPLRSLDVLPNNLPRQLTSFIGREREISEIKRLLSSTPLLTLTGAAGCGKTRLALQVAAEVLEQYRDGVWLVELAPLADPALIPQTLASTLGIREQPGRPIAESLADFLRPKQLLVLLDNCEHLLPSCSRLAQTILRSCAKVQILATSREAMGVAGEVVWLVPSLSTPDAQRGSSVNDLLGFEAAQLFVERAVAARQTFAVKDESVPAVAQVCRRLDGLPLAIELAAARVKVLTVEQIAGRLEKRFDLLTGSSRITPPRHQTLRAAMDWSHELLSEAERTVLRRMSVFLGGFTLEAAEAICATTPGDFDVLSLLTLLVEKSLVVAEEQGQDLRYRLLETVREYGREKLLASGEKAEIEQRHFHWFLGLAEQMEAKRRASDQAVGLERLETEHANLRAALTWPFDDRGMDEQLRLVGALGWFWHIRGHWSEGRERLQAALSAGSDLPLPARAKAQFWAARLAHSQEGFHAARALYEESLSIFRELGSKQDVATLLDDMGLGAMNEGDNESARSLMEESLAIYRELNNKQGIAWLLVHLSSLNKHQGNYAKARALCEEGLALCRELGYKRGVSQALKTLAGLSKDQGQYEPARVMLEESLAISRELGDKDGIPGTLLSLGTLMRLQGEYEAAERLSSESLAIYKELGNKPDMGWALNSLGRTARFQGDLATAQLMHQESLDIFRECGNRVGTEAALINLGDVKRLQGEYISAAALFTEALTALGTHNGEKIFVIECLEGFAALAALEGEAARAAQLFGAADALRGSLGYLIPVISRAEYEREISLVKAELGDRRFSDAWSAGRGMAMDQAAEYALRRKDR